MTKRKSRRAVLRMTGAGAASLLMGRALSACAGDSNGKALGDMPGDGGSAMAGDGGSGDAGAFQPFMFAPGEPWWLQGNYAPLTEEHDTTNLEVEGAIPPELDGLYVRNGSNSQQRESGHWFLGDGMLHGVRIEGGEALWYRNRWVETPLLGQEPSSSPTPPSLTDSASNVAVVHHAGKLLSLGEVGLPYEISTEDLSTVGVYDYGGALMTNMTAHPKVDPATGELLMFGYDFTPPYLTYHQVDASGSLVRSVPIELPASPMMHDFAITENYVIFMDLPILFQLELAIMGDSFPFRWSDDHTARLGVMPRDGGNDDVRWFEIDPCFIFHVMNAHETDSGGIALEAVRHERLWADGSQGFGGTPLLHRFTIDLDDGSVSQEQLDDRPMEFPQLDKRLTGRAYRFGYGLHLGESESGAPGGVHGVLKLDHDRGEVAVHELHEAEQADEATFVPAGPEAGEDEGYLISYVFDRREDRTHLRIIDASDPAAPALARIKLPTRVPFGFHGIWIPSQTT